MIRKRGLLKWLAVIVSIHFCCLTAVAYIGGTTVGNGGDVVICDKIFPEMQNRKIQVLDFYEALMVNQRLQLPGRTIDEKVKRALREFWYHDRSRYNKYSRYYQTFFTETLIADNLSFPELPDQGVVRLPDTKSCKIEQIAYQIIPEVPGEYRYYIRKAFWDQLTDDSKATLVLHEIFYREFIQEQHQHSRLVRYLVRKVLLNEVSSLNKSSYTKLVTETLKLPYLRYYFERFDREGDRHHNDFALQADSLVYLDREISSGHISRHERTEGSTDRSRSHIRVGAPNFIADTKTQFYFNLDLRPFIRVSFYTKAEVSREAEDVHFKKVENGAAFTFASTRMCRLNDWGSFVDHDPSYFRGMELDKEGYVTKIRYAYLETADQYAVYPYAWCLVDGESLYLSDMKGDIEFHPNGMIKSYTTAGRAKLKNVDGKTVVCEADRKLTLNSKGLVVSCAD